MAKGYLRRHLSRFDDQPTPTTTDYTPADTLSHLHGEETDVHMKTKQRREEEVSQTTVEARGLPCPAFAWKGMGPSGYHKPPTIARSSFYGYFLTLSFLFMSAAANGIHLGLLREGDAGGSEMKSLGGSQTSKTCNLAPCMDGYQRAQDELFNKDPALRDRDAICAALMEFKTCAKGCGSDLMFHAVRSTYEKQTKDNGCPEENKDKVKPKTGRTKIERERGPLQPPAMCVYQGPKVYRHCGLFGDPHLRTFNGDFQTCKVQGAWPLVNNDYIHVQVTNDIVAGNADVTATTKLTVIVKGNEECSSKEFHTYQAESGSLPSTFDDGKVRVGDYHSLELVEVEPGAHVEIHVRYINTIVVVRRIGRYLTFSIQMPESLINGTSGSLGGPSGRGFSASSAAASSLQAVQLCLRGCPESELINFQDYLAKRRYSIPEAVPKPSSSSDGDAMENLQGDGGDPADTISSRAEAEAVCREASVIGFYFDFCVFDLMATGDRNFTLSAVSAMRDVLRLDPSAVSTMDNRTSLEKYDQQFYRGGASSTSPQWWRTSFTTLSLVLFSATGGFQDRRQQPRSVLVFLTVLTLLLILSAR